MEGAERLRKGVRLLVRRKLEELAKKAWPPAEELQAAVAATAEALEAALHKGAAPEDYARASGVLLGALGAPLPGAEGDFPDGQVGIACLRGKVSAAEVGGAPEGWTPERGAPDPRRVYRALFIRLLMGGHPAYADRAAAAETAAALERGCYNTAIERGSERYHIGASWARPAFVEYYSEVCGALVSHLDPAGQSSREYGAGLLCDLAEGKVAPAELGAWPASRYCPAANAAAEAEVAARKAQKVEEKASNLFSCPHCRERNCTYVSVQTRSADEPATMVCTCLSCGKGFRVS
jgi:hypothetical protein